MNPLFDSRVVPIAARSLHRHYQNNNYHHEAKTGSSSQNSKNNEIQKHLEAELKKAKKSRKKRELLAHQMSKMQKFFT